MRAAAQGPERPPSEPDGRMVGIREPRGHQARLYSRENESAAERIDRNWNEMLQELRVVQTGVQILAGFLLTLPALPATVPDVGVRGVGSLFYIAYALEHGNFPNGQHLWAIVALVVIGSIIIHGIAAAPVMAALDARRERLSDGHGNPDIATTPA